MAETGFHIHIHSDVKRTEKLYKYTYYVKKITPLKVPSLKKILELKYKKNFTFNYNYYFI